MPFLHTLKASLVAMVLIVLTAVPRLDAAPMDNVQRWMQKVAAIGEKAKFPDLNQQAFGVSSESAFHPVQPGEELQGGPQTPPPFGNQPWSTVGLPPWPALNYPSAPFSRDPVSRPNAEYPPGVARSSYDGARGQYQGVSMDPNHQRRGGNGEYGHPHVDASYGTAVRNEVGQPSTSGGSRVTIALDAATRQAAFGHTPVEGQPWSNKDILKILQRDQWRELNRDEKAAYLNSFGEKVFTKDFYNRLPDLGEPNWKSDEGDGLTQQLVEEYIKIRMDDEVGWPLRLDFQPKARPTAQSPWSNLSRRFPAKDALKSATVASSSDSLLRPFRLGVLSIRLIFDGAGLTTDSLRNALRYKRLMHPVNVVARVGQHNKVYIGQARIEVAK